MNTRQERWQRVLTSLLSRAEHPSTGPHEAQLARDKALYLIGKYQLDIPAHESMSGTQAEPDIPGYSQIQPRYLMAQGCTCRVFVPDHWMTFSHQAMQHYDVRIAPGVKRVFDHRCPVDDHQLQWEDAELAAGRPLPLVWDDECQALEGWSQGDIILAVQQLDRRRPGET